MACHIPFMFFNGKEGLLIIIDELDRRSISMTLEERSRALKLHDKEIEQQKQIRHSLSKQNVHVIGKSDY